MVAEEAASLYVSKQCIEEEERAPCVSEGSSCLPDHRPSDVRTFLQIYSYCAWQLASDIIAELGTSFFAFFLKIDIECYGGQLCKISSLGMHLYLNKFYYTYFKHADTHSMSFRSEKFPFQYN